MKVNLYCLLVGIILPISLTFSQIPNPSFEDWDTNENPVGWITNNDPIEYITIFKSSDTYTGSWAAEGRVFSSNLYNYVWAPFLGTDGFQINFRPTSLKGYYKFTSVAEDILHLITRFKKNGEFIGIGEANLNPTESYAEFSIDISFSTSEVPDTAFIAIYISHASGTPHAGSAMFIDDLFWDGTTNVERETNTLDFKLNQNYPNPFNPTTKISYAIPQNAFVELKVFNLLGQEIATLVNQEKSAGPYEVNFNANNLPSGVYIYQLQADDRSTSSGHVFMITRKMTFLK